MSLELIILTPDHQTKRFALTGDEVALGRAHTNDLCYPEDASLSRRHLRFGSGGDGWFVEDLGSKNGTVVNGARIADRTVLQPGDRLAAGHLVITLVDPDSESKGNVVFVPGAGPEAVPDATVMTSLEGLLSADSTASLINPAGPAAGERPRGEAFGSPVIQALVRAGRELAGHRPLEELFPLILELSIEAVGAERGVLMTLEKGRLVSREVRGDGFRISTTIRDRVLKEKSSLLVRDLQRDEALRQQISISEQQIHTIMAVPLQTEKRVIGLIYVDSRSFVREFTTDDLNLLTVLANVAAIRIEHQRFHEMERQEHRRTQDLEQAAEIQRMILPRRPPEVPQLDLAGHNAPSRMVGGDYYDFIPYDDGRVAVVLGDVAGKGMSAALLMTNLQAMVRILAEDPGDLSKLMSRLDHSVSSNCPDNRFITLFFCVIDPDSGELTYCNAGHNPPLLVRESGEIERLTAMGTVLGILPDLGYEHRVQKIRPGDLIAIYSDGVTEAENGEGEEYGEQRLADLLTRSHAESAESIVDAVVQSVDDWTDGEAPADDLTLVVVRRVQ